MKNQEVRSKRLIDILANEAFHVGVINRLLPRVHDLNPFERKQYNLSMSELDSIKKVLDSEFKEYEITTGRIIRGKDKPKDKALRLNTIILEEVADKEDIDILKVFLLSIIVAFAKTKPFQNEDIKLIFAGLLDDDEMNNALMAVSAITAIEVSKIKSINNKK